MNSFPETAYHLRNYDGRRENTKSISWSNFKHVLPIYLISVDKFSFQRTSKGKGNDYLANYFWTSKIEQYICHYPLSLSWQFETNARWRWQLKFKIWLEVKISWWPKYRSNYICVHASWRNKRLTTLSTYLSLRSRKSFAINYWWPQVASEDLLRSRQLQPAPVSPRIVWDGLILK